MIRRNKKYKEPIYIEGYRDKIKVEFDVTTKNEEHHKKVSDSLLSFFETGISLLRIAVPIAISQNEKTNYKVVCKGYTSKDCTSQEIEKMVARYIPCSPVLCGVGNIAVQII